MVLTRRSFSFQQRTTGHRSLIPVKPGSLQPGFVGSPSLSSELLLSLLLRLLNSAVQLRQPWLTACSFRSCPKKRTLIEMPLPTSKRLNAGSQYLKDSNCGSSHALRIFAPSAEPATQAPTLQQAHAGYMRGAVTNTYRAKAIMSGCLYGKETAGPGLAHCLLLFAVHPFRLRGLRVRSIPCVCCSDIGFICM